MMAAIWLDAEKLETGGLYVIVIFFALLTSAGDVLMAKAMSTIGDLGVVREREGWRAMVRRVITSGWFWLAITAMASSFFSLLLALDWANLSLVAPLSSALVFLVNTLMAKFFLKENVDFRRWAAALLVFCGVLLIKH